jgi:tetratricopeptide (TPR) repeat protein
MLLTFALLAATLVAYAPVRNHQFINWDDNEYIQNNPQVQAGLTLSGVRWAFTTFHAANWHPLTWLSHMLDCELFGQWAGGHHLTNLFLHTLNILLLLLFLWDLTGAFYRSLVVAALFALHPLHVESVAWVAERKDLLSAFFSLPALWAYAAWTRRKRFGYYAGSLVCFALALAAKPMPVTLPCVMLLMDHWPLERPLFDAQGPGWKKRWAPLGSRLVEKWPFFLLSLASCLITIQAQHAGGAMAPLAALPLAARLQNAVMAYGAYIGKTIWPGALSPIYPLIMPLPEGPALISLGVLAAISALVWRQRRLGFLPVGWLWYLGMLVPAIGIVHVGSQALADRYTYMPIIGLFIMAVWGGAHLGDKLKLPAWGGAALSGVLLAALGAATFQQARMWRDSETLFRHAVRLDPRNYIAHGALGDTLRALKRTDEAMVHYQAALATYPFDPQVLTDLGVMAADQGKVEEALVYLHRALQVRPDYFPTRFNLGEILSKARRYEEAAAHLHQATRLQPNDARAHTSLGVAQAHLARWQEAENSHRKAIGLAPQYPEAWNNLGYALAMTHRLEEALAAFSEAVRLRPTFAEAMVNWSNALAQAGDGQGAEARLEEGLAALPKNAELHYNLANLLAGRNRLEAAIDHYAQALASDPKHALAANNRAHALGRAGRTDEAIEQYRHALAIDPNLAMAHNNLGLLLLNLERLDEAQAHFQQALASDAGYANAHFNLGLLHARRSAWGDAAGQFKEALRLRPGFAAAQYKLAETYLAMGDMAAARQAQGRLRAMDAGLAERLSSRLQ